MNDAAVLLYSGALGHPFAVTIADGAGGRRVLGECNDLPTARTWASEHVAESPRIWKRARRGHDSMGYVEVTA